MGKKSQRLFVASVALAAFLTTVAVIPGGARAADDASTITPGFDPTLPPQFDMSKIAGNGNMFQNCSGGLQSSVQDGLQNVANILQKKPNSSGVPGSGLGYGINANCPGSDVGPSADSISCENLAINGLVSKDLLEKKQAAIEMAIANVMCKKGKFQAVKGELSCLTSQADMLGQQISSMQAAYQNNIQKMEQDVQKIDGVLGQRDAQKKDILTKLGGSGGDGGNGSKGLLGILADLKATVAPDDASTAAAIPNQISQLQEEMKLAENAHTTLEESIQQRTMGLAGECFNNRTHTELKCEVNGKPVSVATYAVCHLKGLARLQDHGVGDPKAQVDQSTISTTDASNKSDDLASLLAQMLGDIPQKMPGAGSSPTDGSVTAATILTSAQMDDQYGAQLDSYNTPDFNVHDMVIKQLGVCFQRATRIVNVERNTKSTAIGQNQEAMASADRKLKVKGNTMVSNNALKYQEGMIALTGVNMPLQTGACINSAPQTQINCLNEIQSNLQTLLSGGGKNGAVHMLIKSTDPKVEIGFDCNGLEGCVTALQNTDRNLDIEIQRVKTFKQSYVLKARQSTETFTKQMASLMSAQGAALNNRLKTLNSALMTLGVSGGINIPKVAGEPMQYGENGLPKAPTSALQLIGGQMNPKMLDVSGDNFSSSLSAVSDGMTALNDKMGPLQEASNKVASLNRTCGQDKVEKLADKLNRDVDIISSENCVVSTQFCATASHNRLSELVKNVGELVPPAGDDTVWENVESNLRSGIQGCDHNWKPNKDDPENPTWIGPTAGNTGGRTLKGFDEPKTICSAITTNIKRDMDNIGRAQRRMAGDGDSTSGSAKENDD